MKYRVEIGRTAERELRNLPQKVQAQVRRKLLALEHDPLPPGMKKLRGSETHRLRSGSYRILYRIDHNERLVTIASIGHRSVVYRSIR